MKKLILTLSVLFVSILVWAGKPARIQTLINEYRHQDGFETISVGPLGMSFLNAVIRHSGDMDREDLEILHSFDRIKRLTIVDFEDAETSVRERFTRKVERLLSGMELILEAKDDGDRFSIYGIEDGGTVRDCILYNPGGMLLCIRGSVNLEKLMAGTDL